MPKRLRGKYLNVHLPSLINTQEFEPTGLMIQTLCLHLDTIARKEETISPQQCLKSLGRSPTNWSNWIKMPRFLEWWQQAHEEWFTRVGLVYVQKAVFKRALKETGSTDSKLYFERFDKKYKPATQQDHNFPGVAPPDDEVKAAIERSKALAVESTIIDQPEAETVQDTTPAVQDK